MTSLGFALACASSEPTTEVLIGPDGGITQVGAAVTIPPEFPADIPQPKGCAPTLASSDPTGDGHTSVMVMWDCGKDANVEALAAELGGGMTAWTQTMNLDDASNALRFYDSPDGTRSAHFSVGPDETTANGNIIVLITVDM